MNRIATCAATGQISIPHRRGGEPVKAPYYLTEVWEKRRGPNHESGASVFLGAREEEELAARSNFEEQATRRPGTL